MDQSSSIFVNLGSNFLCHFHCIVLSNVSDSRDFSAEETEVPKEIKLMDSSSQGNFYIYINIEYGLTAQENTASLSFLELPNGAQDKINYSSHQSKKKKISSYPLQTVFKQSSENTDTLYSLISKTAYAWVGTKPHFSPSSSDITPVAVVIRTSPL